ncbi:uncharacterized protein LOC101890812 [Musca domestica]|uniref:Uncharacterized protein LOC101890812 n=1 Tax=Musca domestica TaxID=7370 RepID=A0A1I8N184_MUSDO|nr:uncharacterized protein LOC101890812 [Musca domestica]
MENFQHKLLLTLIVGISSIRWVQSVSFFPSNSAYGIFAALAVPLDLPHRNVFISYNFEANYNLPETWGIPPYATGIEDEDLFEEEARLHSGKTCHNNCTMNSVEATDGQGEELEEEEENNTTSAEDENMATDQVTNSTETQRRRRRRRRRRSMPSLLTRTHFYRILIDKFERSGFEGEPCLLRLICETNSSELGYINGVLGSIIHIMFSPTTSRNENLPLQYYQAEVDGIHDQCHHYEEICTESILDLISTPVHEIIDNLMKNTI